LFRNCPAIFSGVCGTNDIAIIAIIIPQQRRLNFDLRLNRERPAALRAMRNRFGSIFVGVVLADITGWLGEEVVDRLTVSFAYLL
jgi:hypothetical protein